MRHTTDTYNHMHGTLHAILQIIGAQGANYNPKSYS